MVALAAMLVGALVGALLVVHSEIVYPLAIALALLVVVVVTIFVVARSEAARTRTGT